MSQATLSDQTGVSMIDITQIPFNKHLKICRSDTDEQALVLEFDENMKNHVGTFHACAQYALAEACSGYALLQHFQKISESVVPLLWKSQVRYRNPAESSIQARASISPEQKEAFERRLEKKGRASLSVPVEVRDQSGAITLTGTYEWYVRKKQ